MLPASLILRLITLYALLSPIGLASMNGKPLWIIGGYLILQVVLLMVVGKNKQKAKYA